MALNFTDQLMDVQRKARLTGAPLSPQAIRGIAEGYADSTSARLARSKTLELQETGQNIQKEEFGQNLALETSKAETQKSQFAEQLAFQKEQDEAQQRLAEKQMKAEERSSIGAGVGALAGGTLAAAAAFDPTGIALIAGGGMILGKMLGKARCIIISVCTSPDSYEVNIAREYRDKYLDNQTLAGYYRLCVYIVPYILKYPLLKKIVKKVLIDRLIDYGEWILGKKPYKEYRTSSLVKVSFLALCRRIGKGIKEVRNV